MHQSGKILACCSTVLSVAAGLGVASLLAMQDPVVSRAAMAWAASALEASSQDGVADGSSPPPIDQAKASGPDLSASDGPAIVPPPQALPPGAAESAEGQSTPPSDEIVVPARAQWTDREIEAALMECLHLLAPLTADVVPLAPIRNGSCGTPAPVLLRSLGANEKVIVDPPLLINCPMVVALNRWLEKTVQPAAHAAFGSPVARIVGSSYACRNRYNLPNDPLSQHAFANAIDLPVFALADGRKIDIAQGWGPTRRDLTALAKAPAKAKLVPIVATETPSDPKAEKGLPTDEAAAQGDPARITIAVKASSAQIVDAGKAEPEAREPEAAPPAPDPLSTPQAKFLRRVHQGACETFSTVLGPEANDVHRTHLHLDLQDRNSLNVCE
jgi:hypothetical protein